MKRHQDDASQSRREVITAGAAGLAGMLASSLARTDSAQATQGDPILAGEHNSATDTTWIQTTSGFALRAEGVDGGVHASASGGDAVTAMGTIRAESGGDALRAHSTSDGHAIFASSQAGSAILATALSDAGVGVVAESATGNGVGLEVLGRARFSRSGTLVVRAGAKKVASGGVTLGDGSLILALLQENRPGVFVRAAARNGTSNSFTVYLNRPVDRDSEVGWFVVN